jgi:acyl-coenzyme A thioesterase PaaI-like protein
MQIDKLQALPPRDNHYCFGCSPRNQSGLQMKFYAGSEAMYSFLSLPEHLGGWSQIAHGGVVSTVLDEIMGWSAIYFSGNMAMTKNMNTDFYCPVPLQEPVTAKGWISDRPTKREAVVIGEVYNGKDQLCARSRGVFALFTPEAAVRLGVMNQETVDQFLEYLQRNRLAPAGG